jgi:putative FmdB family regulatory protein
MPIFEYQCDDCGTQFEKLLRRRDDEVLCPQCGESHLSTQLSRFAAHSNGGSKEAFSPAMNRTDMPSCAGGMCQNPGFCGRN